MKKIATTLVLIYTMSTLVNAQWQPTNFPSNLFVRAIAFSGSNLYIGTEGNGLYRSTDNGLTWDSSLAGMDVKCIALSGNNVYAGTIGNGVQVSKDNGLNWTGTMAGSQILSLFVKDTKVYAGKWSNDGVYVSSDTGATWTQTSLQQEVNSFIEMGGVIYAGTKNNYVFKSTANFTNWTQVDNNLTNPKIREMAVSGNNLYAATDGGGVYLTKDGGANWTAINTGLYIPYIMTLEVVGTSVYAGTGTIFRTQNEGIKWKEVNHCMPYALEVNTLVLIGNDLYAGTESGLWKADINAIQEKVEVCMVTVDDQNKNEVVWEKPVSTDLDSFYIYKETNVTDVYAVIGRQKHTELSSFVDTTSHPEVQSNKYKVSYNTNCGLPLVMSDHHKTMHLAITQGMGNTWNLIWDPYTGYTVSTYNIYRGTSPSNLQLIGSVSGGNTQYSDLNPPAGFVYYRVEVVSPSACNTSKTFNSSLSNIASNATTGVEGTINKEIAVSLYPNPAREQLSIYLNLPQATDISVQVTDLAGKELMHVTSQVFTSGEHQIALNTGNLANGMYLVNIISRYAVHSAQVVVTH